MNSIDLDDRTACFLTEDQEVGIVVHEEEGEILRMEGENITFDEMAMLRFVQVNEPVSKSRIKDEYDVSGEKIEKVLDKLRQRGQIYQPQKGDFRIVPTQPDKSKR